ncbi:MAG: hypothetical protein A3J29_05095 [Acidobacteria bacterium RIFCSPLOWO2_12_FULL_67_14b]|nr:MAG: hypothetical protein A3J29_05095 [Acidobacteria bacterium RIFCSPLOWO2_12_FULL_67_14b]
MDTVLLGVTVVSLIVALVMSVTAWRLAREEKRHSAARVAALSVAAFGDAHARGTVEGFGVRARTEPEPVRAQAPWAPAPLSVTRTTAPTPVPAPQAHDIRLNEPAPVAEREIVHPSGFLGSSPAPQVSGSAGRQHGLAIAAAVLFVGLATGLVWMMSGPRGTTAAAVGPNMPLELVSLRHDRQNTRLAVSGLVRNPVTGKPVERLSAVVFLFDQQGAFVTSATAPVDFLKLGLGDESPFVVAMDAPPTVARYRVSFRTADGVVPHIDRRGAAPIAAEAEQPVSVTLR